MPPAQTPGEGEEEEEEQEGEEEGEAEEAVEQGQVLVAEAGTGTAVGTVLQGPLPMALALLPLQPLALQHWEDQQGH